MDGSVRLYDVKVGNEEKLVHEWTAHQRWGEQWFMFHRNNFFGILNLFSLFHWSVQLVTIVHKLQIGEFSRLTQSTNELFGSLISMKIFERFSWDCVCQCLCCFFSPRL